MSALNPKRTHLFFLDFWESSSESELSHVLHSLELELDDPELELSELNPVGWFRSTLSAKAVTSERSFYRKQNKHAMLGNNSFFHSNLCNDTLTKLTNSKISGFFYTKRYQNDVVRGKVTKKNISNLEHLVPLFGQLGSSSDCFMPHNWKVHNTTKVLSDCDGTV